jgi:hypothetical protein
LVLEKNHQILLVRRTRALTSGISIRSLRLARALFRPAAARLHLE